MTNKVYVITDLGPGDGGKGGVVHCVAKFTRAHTIIKRGGAQGSHGVRNSNGEQFNFSQWGCGTLEGIPTFLSEQMIVSPEGLLNEADALKYSCGIHEPFSMLSADENCLCATPFHGIASRLKELSRRDNPRGTIGTGVGEAYRDSTAVPELSIRIKDLFRSDIDQKLASVLDHLRKELRPIIEGEFLVQDQELVDQDVDLLFDDIFLAHVQKRFKEVSRLIRVAKLDDILSKHGVAIVETSHGVLNDSETGFRPNVSAIRTLPSFTNDMLRKAGFKGKIVNIGVFRAYAIRHGAGPLPTSDPKMAELLLPGSHKETNRWQGEVRVGPLDFAQIRHAIRVCGGPSFFDGLAVTWFDQIKANGEWNICDEYVNDIPVITSVPINKSANNDELYDVCVDIIGNRLGIPVRIVSFGPTELDKILK